MKLDLLLIQSSISNTKVNYSLVESGLVTQPKSRNKSLETNNFKIIGSGSTSLVYEVEWNQLCNKVSKSSKTMSSKLLNSNTKLVLKVIFPRKELKQLYGTLYLDNCVIREYIDDFEKRCHKIYNLLVYNDYFGLKDHLCHVYACNCCYNPDEFHQKKLEVVMEKVRGVNLMNFVINYQFSDEKKLVNDIILIILQVYYIILTLANHAYYHNDLNLGNIMITNETRVLKLEYPWDSSLTLHLNSQPWVKLIDYDQASLFHPKDYLYRYQTKTKLPTIDLNYFLINFLTQVRIYFPQVKNNPVIGRLYLLHNDFYHSPNFSRAGLNYHEISEDIQRDMIKQVVDISITNLLW